MSSTSHPKGLDGQVNLITTHNEAGQSVFTEQASLNPQYKLVGPATCWASLYTTNMFPVDLSTDISDTADGIEKGPAPQQVLPNGLRFVRTDTPPGGSSPMHRTASIDMGVILEGSVYLELDSGERKLLKQGDTLVQRATKHRWVNASNTEWLRMVFVIAPLEAGAAINGVEIKEEFPPRPA